MTEQALLAELLELIERWGGDAERWGLSWARVLPTVILVPAFGARLLPAAARTVLSVALAVCIAPALTPAPLTPAPTPVPWLWQVAQNAAHGLPVALSSSALLWTAMMAGGVIENVRSSGPPTSVSMFERDTPAIGALLGLFASAVFLQTGGAVRVVAALTKPLEPGLAPWLAAAQQLHGAIGIAVGLAAPVLITVVVWEVAAALIARSATPAYLQPMLAPLRALIVLAALSLVFDALMSAWQLGL